MTDTADKAVKLKQESDKLTGDYVMKIIHNFDPSKDSADDLRRALEDIPRRVDVEIVTKHTDVYGRREEGAAPGRAVGGPVLAGMGAYLVGEKGPELFMPRVDGQIITAGDTAAIVRGLGGAGPTGGRTLDSMLVYAQQVQVQAPAVQVAGGMTIVYNTNAPTTNMPLTVQTNQSPAVVQQSYYTARALAGV